MRILMIGVRRVEESYQNVYVEKRNTHAPSRNAFTVRKSVRANGQASSTT